MQIENLIEQLQGKMVEINIENIDVKNDKTFHQQEFSEELSIVETSSELILDNTQKIDEDEVLQQAEPIHIKLDRILEVEENLSNDVEILTLDGLITIGRM